MLAMYYDIVLNPFYTTTPERDSSQAKNVRQHDLRLCQHYITLDFLTLLYLILCYVLEIGHSTILLL